MSSINLRDILDTAVVVKSALDANAAKKTVSLQKKDVQAVGEDVTKAVNDNVSAAQKEVDATIENLSNAEPWYQSRVTWGAIVGFLLPALAFAGVKTDFIDQETAINVGLAIGAIVGPAITWYGRWIAQKPIGK